MEKSGVWTEQYQKEIEARSKAEVDAAEEKAESVPSPNPPDMFTHTYEKLTQRQRREIKDF